MQRMREFNAALASGQDAQLLIKVLWNGESISACNDVSLISAFAENCREELLKGNVEIQLIHTKKRMNRFAKLELATKLKYLLKIKFISGFV